jgi:hypothetical protein
MLFCWLLIIPPEPVNTLKGINLWPQLTHPLLAYHHIKPLLLHPLCYEPVLMAPQC